MAEADRGVHEEGAVKAAAQAARREVVAKVAALIRARPYADARDLLPEIEKLGEVSDG